MPSRESKAERVALECTRGAGNKRRSARQDLAGGLGLERHLGVGSRRGVSRLRHLTSRGRDGGLHGGWEEGRMARASTGASNIANRQRADFAHAPGGERVPEGLEGRCMPTDLIDGDAGSERGLAADGGDGRRGARKCLPRQTGGGDYRPEAPVTPSSAGRRRSRLSGDSRRGHRFAVSDRARRRTGLSRASWMRGRDRPAPQAAESALRRSGRRRPAEDIQKALGSREGRRISSSSTRRRRGDEPGTV